MALDISVEPRKGPQTAEKGRSESGGPVYLDRRLYMQLRVFRQVRSRDSLIEVLRERDTPGVIYGDLTDSSSIGLLLYDEDPADLMERFDSLSNLPSFQELELDRSMTMTGRTYAIGYESDLEEVLFKRPVRHACHPEWPWAIWYLLRREGTFATLPAEEQRTMLMEHGGIGRAYGKADLGHDIRLASFGLDQNDNDFVIALVGRELTPLSKIVEHMRRTKQTSEYIEKMGPFFVGHAIYQNAGHPVAND